MFAPIDIMTAAQPALPTGTILILDGVGHFPTYAPTERLVDAGRHCIVLVPGLAPGANLDQSSQLSTLRRLATKGVEFVSSSAPIRIESGKLVVRSTLSGVERMVSGDAVVAALGNAANDSLSPALQAKNVTVHVIGDALAPRSMLQAIREGRLIGRAL